MSGWGGGWGWEGASAPPPIVPVFPGMAARGRHAGQYRWNWKKGVGCLEEFVVMSL